MGPGLKNALSLFKNKNTPRKVIEKTELVRTSCILYLICRTSSSNNIPQSNKMANYTMNYVNLIENIWALNCQWLAIVLIGRILWHQWKPTTAGSRRFSTIFLCYLSAEWLMTVGCLPYRFYNIFWWNEQVSGYNTWTQFWVSVGNSNYLAVSTWPAFFLTIDGCLAIQRPLSGPMFKRRMFIATVSAIAVFYGISTVTLFIFAWPSTNGNVNKFKNNAQLAIKCSSGISNLIASAIFLFLLNRAHLKNIKNRLAVVTMCCDICLNTVPSLANYLSIAILNVTLTTYVGNYGPVLVSTDCAICAIYYYKVLFCRKNRVSCAPKQNGPQQKPPQNAVANIVADIHHQ